MTNELDAEIDAQLAEMTPSELEALIGDEPLLPPEVTARNKARLYDVAARSLWATPLAGKARMG